MRPAAHVALLLATALAAVLAARGDELRDHQARKILSALAEARAEARLAPLEVTATLNALAEDRARALASMTEDDRLDDAPHLASRLERAGLHDISATERVFLARNVADLPGLVQEQWRAQRDSWRFAMSAGAQAMGAGVLLAEDGWLIAVVIIAGPASAESPRPSSPRVYRERDLRALEERALALIADARRLANVPPLVLDERLHAIAREHSRDQATRQTLSHEGADGSRVADRIERAGLGFRRVTENVASSLGQDDPAASAAGGWLASPGHRRNALDAGVTRTGLGAAAASDGTVYFTQIFWRPGE